MKLSEDVWGFTLVEIMIIVAIIGLLATLAVPSFVEARNVARESVCINNLRHIDSAKEQYALANDLTDGDALPNGGVDLDTYVKGGFAGLSCPSAAGAYIPNVIGTDPTCPNVGAQPTHIL